jgi:hypothetical protein
MFPPDEQDQTDFPSYLRRRNIFDTPTDKNNWFQGSLFTNGEAVPNASPPDTSINSTSPSSGSSSSSDLAALYKSMMNLPEGAAQAQYRQFLSQNLPTKEQYKPSKISRVGAILSGISEGLTKGAGAGYATAQGILDQPYREALSNYQLQSQRLGTAAKLEQEDVLNKVKLARDVLEERDRAAETARKSTETQGRIANWQSQALARQGIKTAGPGHVSAITGHLMQPVYDSKSPNGIRILDLGQIGRTEQQQLGFEGRRAGAQAGARFPFESRLLGQRGQQGLDLADYVDQLRREGEGAGTVAETQDVLDDKGNVVKRVRTTRKIPTGGPVTGRDVNLPSRRNKPSQAQNIQDIGQTPATVRVKLTDGRTLDIPTDKLAEAKQHDPDLKILVSGQ